MKLDRMLVKMIREAIARLLPIGWADDMANGMMAAFADQARGL